MSRVQLGHTKKSNQLVSIKSHKKLLFNFQLVYIRFEPTNLQNHLNLQSIRFHKLLKIHTKLDRSTHKFQKIKIHTIINKLPNHVKLHIPVEPLLQNLYYSYNCDP